MKAHIPSYMYSKGSSGILVASTAVFIEMFILIFSPFQSRDWVNNDWQYLGWSAAVVGIAALIMLASRSLMNLYGKKHDISYWLFFIWVAVEILVMTLVYCLSLILGFPEFTEARGLNFMHLYKEVRIGLVFIFLIPYIIIFLALEVKEKNARIQQLMGEIDIQKSAPERFNFYDEKGELRLSVQPELVYYLEGADNYVIIHHLNDTKMERTMIRNTLKNLAWHFRNQGLIRCSRSYIVNIMKVQMLRKVDGEVMLDFGSNKIPPIAVSKGYMADVIEKMQY